MIDSTLCYLCRGDEVLMMHRTRKKNDMNHDKWIAVGGRFEPGEGPEECAMREVKEETGLTMVSPRYRGVVTFINDQYEMNTELLQYNLRTHIATIVDRTTIVSDSNTIVTTNGWYNTSADDATLYQRSLITAKDGKTLEGEMTDCDEGELVWLPKAQINDLPMWEGDRVFHRLLAEGAPFFNLELVYSGEKLLSAILDGNRLHI